MTAILFALAIAAGTALPITIKWLLIKQLPFEEVVLWCSVLVMLFCAVYRPKSFIPGAPVYSRVSLFRVIVGGAALSLSTFAYKSLTATEVNMIARLDLALFIFLFGSNNRRFLALVILVFGAAYSVLSIRSGHAPGILAIWSSTLLTAVGYWFTRKAANVRDPVALILPPYLGAAVYSVVLLRGVPRFPIIVAPELFLTAVCAISLCILCAELFKRARFGVAELTGCLALLCTFIFEGYSVGVFPPETVGAAACICAALGACLVYWEEFPKWLKNLGLRA